MGYACEPTGKLDDATVDALMSFQSDADLTVSGECCDDTRSALEERYGS